MIAERGRCLILSEWVFVSGQRGKPKLVVEGNTFYRTKSNGNRTYWSCSRYKSHKCRSKLITAKNTMSVLLTGSEHTHEPKIAGKDEVGSTIDGGRAVLRKEELQKLGLI